MFFFYFAVSASPTTALASYILIVFNLIKSLSVASRPYTPTAYLSWLFLAIYLGE